MISKRKLNPKSTQKPDLDASKIKVSKKLRKKEGSQTKATSKTQKSSLMNAYTDYLEPLPLASPFISRASSPTDFDPDQDIPTTNQIKPGMMGPPAPPQTNAQPGNQKKKRALTDTVFDPNAPDRSRSYQIHRNKSRRQPVSQSLSRPATPDKSSRSRRRSARSKDTGPEAETGSAWRNRRPSAPSNLQRPNPHGFLGGLAELIPHKRTDDGPEGPPSAPKNLPSGPAIHLGPVVLAGMSKKHYPQLPPASRPCLDSINDDPTLVWMRARGGVDFNRPPSQMSLIKGFRYPEVENVFLSAGESSSDDSEKDPFEFRSSELSMGDFERNASTSTPGRALARTQSLPTLGSARGHTGGQTISKSRSMSMSVGVDSTMKTGDGLGNEDMDLTSLARREESHVMAQAQSGLDGEEDDFGGHTPWITDSLISPPTIFRKHPGLEIEAQNHDENNQKNSDVLSQSILEAGRLSSPFNLSCAKSSSSSSVDIPLADEVATVLTGAASRKSTAKRTRSGTIVPVKPVASSTTASVLNVSGSRRTRSGTIIGPSTGRVRSGTIAGRVPRAEPRGQEALSISSPNETRVARRTRTGTIVGPIPPSAANSRRRSRSGSVLAAGSGIGQGIGQRIVQANTSREEADQGSGELTNLDNEFVDGVMSGCRKNSDGPSLRNLNPDAVPEEDGAEVDCFVDSLYVPRLSSSPDPIDFLSIVDVKNENGYADVEDDSVADAGADGPRNGKQMKWCVAYDPPSPEVMKKTRLLGSGMRGSFKRWSGMVRKKVKGKKTARFDGLGAAEIEAGEEQDFRLEEEILTDDELLLRSDGLLATF